MCNFDNSKVNHSIQLLDKQPLLCNHMPVSYSNTIARLLGILPSVVSPLQESVNNSSSLFNYGLDNSYNDLINDFDSYLEYGEGYQNRMALKDALYE